MNTFVRVDDEVLVRVVQQARKRLVFVAPGVRPKVAEALARSMEVVTSDSMHIVLDVDSEVCRLGYGDIKGLECLQAAATRHGQTVNHHPGIRIGLLIADDTTLIYSPTPLLIEAESSQPDKPNAIVLRLGLPQEIADACAVGEEKHATLEVGKDPINLGKVEIVKQDLKEKPAKPFNLARIERVFNSMLHYVEFRIEDYRLTTRAIHLNPKLFGVRNEEIVRRLTNRYFIFRDSDALTVEIPQFNEEGKDLTGDPKVEFGPHEIDLERNRIKDRFIIEAREYGLLILRRHVDEFEKAIALLKKKLEAYKNAVLSLVGKRTDEIVDELLKALTESLKKNPPDHWRSRIVTGHFKTGHLWALANQPGNIHNFKNQS